MDGNHEKNEENCRKKDKNRGKDEENHENNGKNCGKYGENEENSKGRRKNEEDYEEEEDEFSQSLGFTSAEIASKFLLAPASPKLHVKKTLDSAAATNGQLLGRRPKPPVPVVEQDGQLLLLSPENR